MTFSTVRKLALALPWALGFLTPLSVMAQVPIRDAGAAPQTEEEKELAEDVNLPAYHHSIFSWEHTVTTATLGVGQTPQSYNPTYTMGFVAKTRYYFVDDYPKGEHFSLRLDGGLYREFTNNDLTTQRGEWTLSDTDLAGVYFRRFQGSSDHNGTLWEVRPLTLTLPTSKVSYESGRYFAPGVAVGITNITPWLRGKVKPKVASTLRLAVDYKRWFARATVPTNPSLERVRLTPDGRSLPSDSLSGASLVRDELDFTMRLRMEFGDNVLWTTDAAFVPGWKYDLPNNVQLCGVVQTGCVDVGVASDDSRYLVRTLFNTEVSVRIMPSISIELGYGNSANQLAQDGHRRGYFYSPYAVFYTSLSFMPHELAPSTQQVAQRTPSSPAL